MLSAIPHYKRPLSSGEATYPAAPSSEAPVGEPVHKVEGYKQATGEARFTSDLSPAQASTSFFAAPVLANKVGQLLVKIDASKALATPGVVDFVCAEDLQALGGRNQVMKSPYLVFAETSKPTQCIGQIVGMVVATSASLAIHCAKEDVQMFYSSSHSPLTPAPGSADPSGRESIVKGAKIRKDIWKEVCSPHQTPKNVKSARKAVTSSGSISSGGQKHFYMETQTTLADASVPGHLLVASASQVFRSPPPLFFE